MEDGPQTDAGMERNMALHPTTTRITHSADIAQRAAGRVRENANSRALALETIAFLCDKHLIPGSAEEKAVAQFLIRLRD